MGIVKIIFSIVLLPVVVGITKAFCSELFIAREIYHLFLWGVITYVVTHLFFVNFHGIYQGGQKIFADGLKFSPFLSSFVPLVLPLFPMILMVAFFVCAKFFAMKEWEPYFVFFTGMTSAMHLILTAQIIREEDGGVFKAHYFFTMSLGIIFNLIILSALLSMNFSSFSFMGFFDRSLEEVKNIYFFVYDRLTTTR